MIVADDIIFQKKQISMVLARMMIDISKDFVRKCLASIISRYVLSRIT